MVGNSERILKFCGGLIKDQKINLEKNIYRKKLSMKSADKVVTKPYLSSTVFKEIPILIQQQKNPIRVIIFCN